MPPAMDSQLARSNCIFVSGSSEGEEREETGPLLQTDAEEEKDTPLLLSVCMHKQWVFFYSKIYQILRTSVLPLDGEARVARYEAAVVHCLRRKKRRRKS